MARAWIGTSGWVYPHWKGRFYPAKLPTSRWLEHYATIFDTVELNNPFYRARRIEGWLARDLDVYAYFNNDVPDHAPRDAQRLREMIGGPAVRAISGRPDPVEFKQRPWLAPRTSG